MTNHTLNAGLRKTYAAETVRSFRKMLKQQRGWSLARFAKETGYSTAYIKFVERGERRISVEFAKALDRLERDQAYCAKEIAETEAETLDWLLAALERRASQLTPGRRKRLKKILEATE